ncbi:hypothetical protein TraAM80_01980 [Trypanosoma rangeli]|uniref:Uncharacterized protein n=1 Tax=Trypanosoma rangeli TaxID=5698 RepID=A0A422NWT7_TRYRA|nr:uncharacterized protein TraAM80_01980 [Trypanosoma rangeli]RNF09928.1 hypothetical protein TraAM80_01980 [Trypanosoma rangeli]|eukprot:RNF09928.1 hypothetical protein TraAM80_01980 [Trypanosoma rangeli]
MRMMCPTTFRAKMLTNMLLFVAFLASQVCRAEKTADALQLTRKEGPVELLRLENMRWHAAWGAGNVGEDVSVETRHTGWDDFGEVRITDPAGERMVTVTMPLHFTSLLCEESRKSVGGSLRGRCTLRPSPALSQNEFFFEYRVTQKATEAGGGAVTEPQVSQTCGLYEENARSGTELEVGTVVYDAKKNVGEDQTFVILIWLKPTRAAQDQVAWLSGALRLTGVSMDVEERRHWMRRAASTVAGRWGCPLLAVLVLYGALWTLEKIVARRHPQSAKPKHD